MVQFLEEIGYVWDRLLPCPSIKSFMQPRRLRNPQNVVSETVFSVRGIEALYELFKKISSTVVMMVLSARKSFNWHYLNQ